MVGTLFLSFTFISQTGEASEFLRMFLELPFRYFGTAYIQAMSLALIFNWAFFGLELRKFYRIWLLAVKFMFFFGLWSCDWICQVKIGHGVPLMYIVDGSLLLGLGIILVCGFDHTASMDSVLIHRNRSLFHQLNAISPIFNSSTF